jgi:hypothetical protein
VPRLMSSRIRLYSCTTTLPKTVLHNVQPLDIPRRVWKMAMSAVCSQLRWSAYDVAYGNIYLLGCGDVADISNNKGTTATETNCNTTCSGDSSHLCGGAQRLQLYLWNGTLNNWHTPSNIGRYEVRTKIPLPIHLQARYNFI